MTLRLLVLTAAYPSPTEPQRGIYLENLHRSLLEVAGDALEMRVVAPRVHRSDPSEELRHGIEVRRFPYLSGGRRLKEMGKPSLPVLASYAASGLWTTLRELRRSGAGLLLCHWVLPTGPIARLASRALGVPLALYAHGSDIHRVARSTGFYRQLTRWTVTGAARVFAVSRDLARILSDEFSVAASSVRTVPMGVAPEFTPAERAADVSEKPVELLYVGDLVAEKGVDDLLQAWEIIREKRSDVHLSFAGDGPLAEQLRARARELTEGSVSENGSVSVAPLRVLGSVAPSELARHYRDADLLVHASHGEGSPLAIMEALSCALPIVATRVGGVPDLVESGKTGELVPPHQPRAFAAALERLLAEPATLQTMRSRLRESKVDLSARSRARELYPALMEAAGAESGD